MRRLVLIAAVTIAAAAEAATTITLSGRTVVSSVKRLGINLGGVSYYDDRQIMKEVVFRNPGFEGTQYGSVVRCATPTAGGCIDNNPTAAWPAGFWTGATFEVVNGPAAGRTGTITSSSAPAGGQGTALQFSGSGPSPAAGDFVILRKRDPADDASAGWLVMTSGGGTVAGERSDLPPDAIGQQAIRLSASGGGQSASVNAVFDSTTGLTFLQLQGNFRLRFKARGTGGENRVTVILRRNAPASTTLLSRTVSLGSSWTNEALDFTASESNSIGSLQLQFAVAQSSVLLDEVSLTRTDSDPGNRTSYRDAVVSAVEGLRPGLLRYWAFQLGDSLDNQLAAPMARLRSGFRTSLTTGEDLQMGLHEFLELAERAGAEPWYVMPITFSAAEARNLIEYLGGDVSTPYGARRAARGRATPWTAAFPTIHLELGNESWNLGQRGATIESPSVYGARARSIFDAVRAAPGFSASRFNLVVGGWAAEPNHNRTVHDASTSHDSVALAPYFAGIIDSFASDEALFGPLFAEPEMLSQTGYMRQNYDTIRNSSRPVPLAIYEVNLHTTLGSISQAALDAFTPSAGAGLAVADHMLTMLKHLGIRNQMFYSLSGYRYVRSDGKTALLWGSVRDFGVTDRRRPQYLALRLLNGVMGGDLTETIHSGDDPTWNQPLVNGIQYPAAHYLRSYAFAEGQRRALVMFNVHRTSALDVIVAGAAAPTGAVTMERLTAPAISDTNENSERVVVTSQNLGSAATLTLPPYSLTVLRWQTVEPKRRAVRK